MKKSANDGTTAFFQHTASNPHSDGREIAYVHTAPAQLIDGLQPTIKEE